ncbi:MAG: MBL fold metallo-hydrolase [Pseudomonadota bacterium]|nr:MBL fold metallo-hydrolase [Pseudomonadales bacterium]MEE3290690.1 MBL fold metallo-hydrolase [Pseudomonadota bacterium]
MNYLRRKVLFFVVALLLSYSSNGQELSDRDNPEVQRIAPFQVFDNLYYVGARWVSAWLLVSDQGLILFDALYGDLTDIAINGIRELGFDPDDIRYVIVSHAHYDHIGGARRLQEEFGSVVMMTEADWNMTTEPAVYQEYPAPIRHLSVSDGSTLNLGRTRLRFMQTPGHTPGVLSTRFTVYDNGYPHEAFLFGGAGLNFSGVERTEIYINSIERLMQMENIEVNIPNHPDSGEIFERYEILQDRQDGDLHPFVDPESWDAWLDILMRNALGKLEREREAAN